MAIEPVTREERFLAAAGGRSVTPPEPITRKEQLLQGIIDAVKSGGGGDSGCTNAVLYTPQNLTPEQQKQARDNVGVPEIPPENTWELVERVALGYELLTEKPDDWATNYANYYWWVDAEISQCKSAEWQAGNMYKSVEYEPVLEVARTIEPNGENYNFKKIYIKSATTKAEGITGQASVNYVFNKNAILTAAHLDTKPVWGAARAQIDGGVIMLDGQAGSLSKWNGANAIYPSVYRNMLVFTDSINEVAIKSTNPSVMFAKGTVFEIWGVRNNA